MIGNPYFGPNNAMSVDANKAGMYGQNAMVLPGSYGGDPYSVMGNSGVGLSGSPAQYGPQSIQDFRASMLPFMPQQPQNPYQGMTPFGNHYTRYLMGGGQRQNRLARPYGVQQSRARFGGLSGEFGAASSGYGGYQPGVPQPYDSVG